MKTKFCPDCGEACEPDAKSCPECEFPLVLHMGDNGLRLMIEQTELPRWNRIAGFLSRSGVAVRTSRVSAAATVSKSGGASWLLPLLGALLFVSTLVWGPALADMLWERPQADLSAEVDSTRRPQTGANPDADSDILFDALRTSREQHQPMSSPEDEIDQNKLAEKSEAEIAENCAKAVLLLNVGEERGFASLISDSGYYLAWKGSLTEAFKRGVSMVQEEGSFVQRIETVIPIVRLPNGQEFESELVEEAGSLPLALLKSRLSVDEAPEVDYFVEIGSGDEVWLGFYDNGRYQPKRVRIEQPTTFEDGIQGFLLSSSFGNFFAGSPILDVYGQVVGFLVPFDGRDAMITTKELRERAPLIYRHVYQ